LIDFDLQIHPPVELLTFLWGDPVPMFLDLLRHVLMRSEESVSGNPVHHRSTTKEDVSIIQEEPSGLFGYLYSLIDIL
jgi:hypothetical protein